MNYRLGMSNKLTQNAQYYSHLCISQIYPLSKDVPILWSTERKKKRKYFAARSIQKSNNDVINTVCEFALNREIFNLHTKEIK
jgi:hypothetical protein